jgi:hypothetical protein
MSTHSYSRLWTHLIWETLNREPMLDKRAAAKASSFLTDYSKRTYSEEYAMFVQWYSLEWRAEVNH